MNENPYSYRNLRDPIKNLTIVRPLNRKQESRKKKKLLKIINKRKR